ncbi:MAG: hypothetical protein AAFN93_11010 [Bacteroidota bacterium]
MLYLHKNNDDQLGDKIKDYLLEISAAHRQVDITNEESHLRENDIVIRGEQAVFRYLEAYGSDLEFERSLSADACIVRPDGDGTVC